MNFRQKLKAIYHYALHGKLIKSPMSLLKRDKIRVVYAYLTTHELDNMPLKEVLS